MKHKTIDGVTYYPRTNKEGNKYYPAVLFVCDSVRMRETMYLNTPQDTRSKARTIAINHIKNIGK